MITLYPNILSLLSKIFKKKPYTDGLSALGDAFVFVLIPIGLLIIYILGSALLFGIFSTVFLSNLITAGYIVGIGVAADILVYIGVSIASLFENKSQI